MKKESNKRIAVLLAAVLALSLTACANSNDDDDDDEDEKPAVTTVDEAESEDETTTAPADESAPEDTATEPPKELAPEEAPADSEIKSPVLEQAGEFDLGDLDFYTGDFIYKGTSSDNIELFNFKGEKLLDGSVKFAEPIDYTDGVYSYTKFEGDMTYEGLMDADGNEILSASEHVGTFAPISERFVTAYIPEGVTTDENEAIYYVTASQFSITPNDEDTLYKGTVKVYDLETRKFLENTARSFDPRYRAYGDIIQFYDEDNNTVSVSADDQTLDLGSDYSPTGSKFLIGSKDGKTLVADHSKNEIFTTDYNVTELDHTDYYYCIRDFENNKSGVVSEKGRTIIEPKYDSLYGLSDNYFQYGNGDMTGIVKADGTEITPADYKIISEAFPGYFTCRDNDNVSSLVDRTGKVLFTESDGATLYTIDAPYYLKDSEYFYLVLSTGEFSLKLSNSGTYLGNNLLYSYQEKTVYDLFTGEKLFEDINGAYTAYGRLYIVKGDKVTIYDIK